MCVAIEGVLRAYRGGDVRVLESRTYEVSSLSRYMGILSKTCSEGDIDNMFHPDAYLLAKDHLRVVYFSESPLSSCILALSTAPRLWRWRSRKVEGLTTTSPLFVRSPLRTRMRVLSCLPFPREAAWMSVANQHTEERTLGSKVAWKEYL